MSKFDLSTLNNGDILVNGTIIVPWWKDERLIDTAIALKLLHRSPIYDGPIPMEDARALLTKDYVDGFAMGAFKPVAADAAELFDREGNPFPYRIVPVPGKQVVGPVGRDVFYNTPSAGYDTVNHQFADVLLDACAAILDGGLTIVSVGRLADGAQGFVTVSLPELWEVNGVSFLPYLQANSSWDSSVATQWGTGNQVQLCDNTVAASLRERERNGRVIKVKHTKHSKLSIANARQALQLLDMSGEQFAADIQTMCNYTVSDAEWSKLVDALVPLPVDDTGAEVPGRGLTMAANKRDELGTLYFQDERAASWHGNAFGVLQAFNTYGQHNAIVRGTNRVERNMMNAISGKIADQDALVLDTLAAVCERELVFA